jgi:hypothetical protein
MDCSVLVAVQSTSAFTFGQNCAQHLKGSFPVVFILRLAIIRSYRFSRSLDENFFFSSQLSTRVYQPVIDLSQLMVDSYEQTGWYKNNQFFWDITATSKSWYIQYSCA